ncbi:LOW QUALITY PROTEIN: outer dynein arm-docking complex subunit 2-like [Uloborus diversus]|uniref:LOW QUALITY PROTEIN: outer dynein arm-docking complex subunit 2-like n=1 Tax=Uloborus diversus TaxID=327109 RepID=UPI00240A58D7|nr:LOW QUALITY PROTEIN: outer dynein arm-docking complex subunit 2-like [Uloborus diversus]
MFPRYIKIKPSIFEIKSKEKATTGEERDNESNCSSSETEDLEDIYKKRPDLKQYDCPNDYWKFLKAIKYLAHGRPLISTLSLLICYDCDFQDPIMLKGLTDYRVIEVLLNLLECNDKRLQFISLRFLRKLSKIRMLRLEIVHLDGIQSMVKLLEESQIDLKLEVVETIYCIADFHKSWTAIRISGGIPLLVNMIYLPLSLLYEASELNEQLAAVLRAAELASLCLFAACKCRKNQIEFLLSGALRGCHTILKTPHVKLATTALQLIQRCANQKKIKLAIKSMGMLEVFRKYFYSEDQNLIQATALAAFKCAEGEEAKRFFGKSGFVDKLYEIIQMSTFHSDNMFMASISGALWKCAEIKANLARFQALNVAPLLIQLLSSQPPKVQEYLVACLSCCMDHPQMRTTIRKNNGIETLIGLLKTTHSSLIMHLNKALANASKDKECLILMENHNALRLIWSHLKNENASVISNTLWQLAAILKNTENSAVYIRSLVGAVQLLTDLLHSRHTRILTPVCALIVVLSKETENLRILTNYQVVQGLSNLTNTRCRRLRYHMCLAITACCKFKDNRHEFANRKVVYPLIKMLKSKTVIVSGAATHALRELSWIPKWCAIMYNTAGVYDILIRQMLSKDHEVQESAADITQRMRLFPLNRDGNIPKWLIDKHALFFA